MYVICDNCYGEIGVALLVFSDDTFQNFVSKYFSGVDSVCEINLYQTYKITGPTFITDKGITSVFVFNVPLYKE